MKNHIVNITSILTLLSFGVCCSSKADSPFEVNLLGSQYTTYVMVQGIDGESGTITQAGNFELWPWGDSRMTVSPASLSDAMYAPVSGTLSAQAGTAMFGVSAYSSMGGSEHLDDYMAGAHNATAGAESEIWFSPVASGTANLELDFLQDYEPYVQFNVSLIDLTSSQQLWSYEWLMGEGTITLQSGSGGSSPRTARLSLATDLNATDSYALDMFTQTFSDRDRELGSIQLSGLEAVTGNVTFVPEPSAFTLVGLGAALLLVWKLYNAQNWVRPICRTVLK